MWHGMYTRNEHFVPRISSRSIVPISSSGISASELVEEPSGGKRVSLNFNRNNTLVSTQRIGLGRIDHRLALSPTNFQFDSQRIVRWSGGNTRRNTTTLEYKIKVDTLYEETRMHKLILIHVARFISIISGGWKNSSNLEFGATW